MTPPPAVTAFQAAAHRLGEHPHDHGWRELYRLFAYGLETGQAPQLAGMVATAQAQRPGSSYVHLVTLLGIAVRSVAGEAAVDLLLRGGPDAEQLGVLEDLLARHRPLVTKLVTLRQNSFTGTRRFLLPQILLAAYFARHDQRAQFADLGTGLGILPRQLNSRRLFDRYAAELVWPDGQPAYQPLPLGSRHGVDRGPLPDLSWVRTCYGPSEYYDDQFQELLDALAAPEVAAAGVRYHELDLTDSSGLRRFVAHHRINVVTLSFTLYQLAPADRVQIIRTLAGSLHDPGLIVVMEPNDSLTRPGCTVTVQDRAHPRARPLCMISDSHFRGYVTRLAGYPQFVSDYPIRFEPPSQGAVDAASRDHAAG